MRSTTNHRLFRVNLISMLLAFPFLVNAQASLTGTTYTQNFDGIGSTATAVLPVGFKFSITGGTVDYNAASNISATTHVYGTSGSGVITSSSQGGSVNWANGVAASSSDRSIGFITSGSTSPTAGPKDVFFAFTNNTGSTINDLSISFDYEKYRSGSRAFDWTFFHGATASSVNTAGLAGNLSSPADASNNVVSNPPNGTPRLVVLTGVNIANGATYYLRWRFAGSGASTNGQGFGIDNISLTATLAAAVAPVVTGATLTGTYGTPFTTYTVNTTNTPTSFSISGLPNGLNLDPATGVISGTPNTSGSSSYTITASNSAGSGTSVLTFNIAQKDVTITGLSAQNKVFDGTTAATLSGTATLNGVLAADVANVALAGVPIADFATSSIGTGIAVSVSGYTLSGSAASNYNLLPISGLVADITSSPSPVVTSSTMASEIYASASAGYTITATNSPTSFTATGLPNGMAINTSTGEITGTPTSFGTVVSTIGATNAGGTGTLTLTFTIAPKDLTVTGAVAQNKTYDGTTSATISGSTLVGVYGSDMVTISNSGVFVDPNVATTIQVNSTQVLGGADANKYTLILPTGLIADITKANQTITFNAIPTQGLASGSYNLIATASSGLPISYASSDPLVATVSGSVATLVNLGTTTITASQAGNANYNAATDVLQPLTVIVPPVVYGFGATGSPTTMPTSGAVSNLTFGSFAAVQSVNTSSVTVASTSSLSPFAIANNAGVAAQTGAYSSTTSAYFEYTITPAAGFVVDVDNIAFHARSTSSGPTAIEIRTSADNFAAPINTFAAPANGTWASYSFPVSSSLTNASTPLTIRIIGHSGTSGSPLTSTSAFNWRIDSVSTNATAQQFVCVPATISLQSMAPTCIADSNGYVKVVISSAGTAPYTYSWASTTNGALTSTIDSIGGLVNDTYTVTVTSTGGCTATASTTLNDTTVCVSLTLLNVGLGCAGDSSKSIEVMASGGLGMYSYSISPDINAAGSNSTGTFVDLAAGTYSITVHDASEPKGTLQVVIVDPAAVTATYTVVSQPTCFGTSDAVVAVVGSGGTTVGLGGEYNVDWYTTFNYPSPGVLANDTNYAVGSANASTYTVVVSDDYGCTATNTVIALIEPPAQGTTYTASACDSYMWLVNNTSYNVSGTYYSADSLNGCPKLDTLVLTITPTTGKDTNVFVCNSYTWPASGVTYTSSGVYFAANGCHVDTLTLGMNSSMYTYDTVTACNSYTWLANATTYTISTSTTHSALNTNTGCNDTATLVLTINNSVNTNDTVVACSSYSWPVNSTTYTTSGTYSNVVVNSTTGCNDTNKLILTINAPVVVNLTVSANFSYTLPWGQVVTSSGTYSNTTTLVNGCDSTVNVAVTIGGVRVSPKVFLAGPYSGNSTMTDSLRSILPTTEPYGNPANSSNPYFAVFTHVNGGNETINPSVLSASGPSAVVDWVFVSLRSSSNAATVLSTRSALLLRNGNVVDVDGSSAVEFAGVSAGNYFVAVEHRNHLGAMLASPIALSLTAVNADFTTSPLYTKPSPNNNASPLTGASRVIAGVQALYAGNCNISNMARKRILTYNSTSASDRAALLLACPGVSSITGYIVFDCDMNGVARFNGLVPDRLVIYQNVASSNTVIAYEQLP
jgi:hypothetical protein